MRSIPGFQAIETARRAEPECPCAIDEHRIDVVVRQRGRVGRIVGDALQALGTWAKYEQTGLAADPEIAGRIARERIDLLGERRRRLILGRDGRERFGDRVEMVQAAARSDPQRTIRHRQQPVHVVVDQALLARVVAETVLPGVAAEHAALPRAGPDRAVPGLRHRRDDAVRQRAGLALVDAVAADYATLHIEQVDTVAGRADPDDAIPRDHHRLHVAEAQRIRLHLARMNHAERRVAGIEGLQAGAPGADPQQPATVDHERSDLV